MQYRSFKIKSQPHASLKKKKDLNIFECLHADNYVQNEYKLSMVLPPPPKTQFWGPGGGLGYR